MPKIESRNSRRQRQRQPEAKQETVSAVDLRRPAIIGVILAIVTFGVLSGVCHRPFFGVDDSINVYANPHLSGQNGPDTGFFWQNPYFRLYMPVTDTLWAIIADTSRLAKPALTPDGTTSDFNAPAFHQANLIVHMLNVLMVFLILRLMLRGKDGWIRELAAGAGALLFALHPMQVESVAWVTQMNTLLSTFFSLLTLYFYLQFAMSAQDGKDKTHQYILFGVATAAYILALLAKPTAVAVPLIAWALDCLALKRTVRLIWPGILLWLVLAGICVLITQDAQTGQTKIAPVAFWFRPFMAGDALAFYIQKLFAPLNLGIDYGRTPTLIRNQTPWFATWLIPVVIIATLWWRRKQWPIAAASAGIFAAALLPVLGLAPHYYHAVSVVADRYIYMALLGPALALAWLLSQERVRVPLGICMAVILILLGWRSAVQVSYWRDTMSITKHTADVSPNGWFARNNLATALDKAGKPAEALPYSRQAAKIKPDFPKTHENLGIILNELGQTDESAKEFKETIRLAPDDADAHFNLAYLLTKQNDIQGAIAQYRETLRAGGPGYPNAQSNLQILLNAPAQPEADPAEAKYEQGADLGHQGKLPEAIALFREALALNPNLEEAHADLGVALFQQGAVAEAIDHFRTALRLKPDSAQVHFNLGMILNSQGKRTEAVGHFRAALKIQPGFPQAQAMLDKMGK